MAVQWHPELGWENDALSQRLFRTFVNEASVARESDLALLSTPA
jgi:gamma-glutamyl-gamma-aminobutyrate hydrolase PuuD